MYCCCCYCFCCRCRCRRRRRWYDDGSVWGATKCRQRREVIKERPLQTQDRRRRLLPPNLQDSGIITQERRQLERCCGCRCWPEWQCSSASPSRLTACIRALVCFEYTAQACAASLGDAGRRRLQRQRLVRGVRGRCRGHVRWSLGADRVRD